MAVRVARNWMFFGRAGRAPKRGTWPPLMPTGRPHAAPLRSTCLGLRTGDFDNLQDLGLLLQHVRDSDVMLVLLTADVMLRPWCILEIHAAVSAGIPLVGVTLRGKGYDHALAQRQLTLLDMDARW